MNRLKKISLAYAFQIFGVIMLFGYPGCSSNMKEQKMDTGNKEKEIVEKKHAAVNAVWHKAPQVPRAIFLLQHPVAVQINFASYLSFSK